MPLRSVQIMNHEQPTEPPRLRDVENEGHQDMVAPIAFHQTHKSHMVPQNPAFHKMSEISISVIR